MTKHLSGEELLEKTYNELCSKSETREKITFSDFIEFSRYAPGLLCEIADDSDFHRTRKGYMLYTEGSILDFSDTKWLVCFGKAWGSYPAQSYGNDISAFEATLFNGYESKEEKAEYLELIFRRGSYFHNSLIHTRSNGIMGVITKGEFGRKTIFGEKMSLFFENAELKKYIAQKPEYDERYFVFQDNGLVHPCSKNVMYMEGFEKILANKMAGLLKETDNALFNYNDILLFDVLLKISNKDNGIVNIKKISETCGELGIKPFFDVRYDDYYMFEFDKGKNNFRIKESSKKYMQKRIEKIKNTEEYDNYLQRINGLL